MKKVLSLIVVLMLIVVLVGCGKKKVEEKTPELMHEYEYNDLVFKNTSISAEGESSVITSTLTNTTDEDKQIGMVKLNVTYVGDTGIEHTAEMLIYFGDKIQGNQTLQTETTVEFNTTSITKVEYEFVQK